MTVLEHYTVPATKHGPVLQVVARLNRQGVALAEAAALAAEHGAIVAAPVRVLDARAWRHGTEVAAVRAIPTRGRAGMEPAVLLSGEPGALVRLTVALRSAPTDATFRRRSRLRALIARLGPWRAPLR